MAEIVFQICQKFHGILIELKRERNAFVFAKFGMYKKMNVLPIMYGTFLLHVINSRLKKSLSFRQRAEPQSMLPLTESELTSPAPVHGIPFWGKPFYICETSSPYYDGMPYVSWKLMGKHPKEVTTRKLSWSRKTSKVYFLHLNL